MVFFLVLDKKELKESLSVFFKKQKNCLEADKKFLIKKQEKYTLLKRAENCLEKEQFSQAVLLFEKFLLEAKNTPISIKNRREIEKKIADISFYNIKKYNKAIKYYTKLLMEPSNSEKNFLIQKHIAESFFYLKKYNQALKEAEKCFYQGIALKREKELVFLQAHILMEKKDLVLSLSFFEKQIDRFPEEEAFFREYKALIYEARKEFLLAVGELEKIKTPSPFIRQKIHRLLKRQNNQPGF